MTNNKTQEESFKIIQGIISNNPVIIIGSGASVSYGISSMWDLAEILKEYFENNTFEDDKRKQVVAKFLRCIDDGMGLEDALLEVKMPQDIERFYAAQRRSMLILDRRIMGNSFANRTKH